jgi:hypothetical protein
MYRQESWQGLLFNLPSWDGLHFWSFASQSGKTFCSKHVTRALKAACIESVQGLNENIVTPSKLYKVLHEGLRKDRFVVGSVDFKQRALMESGTMFAIQ